MRKILTSCAILIAGFSFAQVSISGDATHTPRATLDVKEIENSSVPNGIIIPNVSRYEAEHMPKPTKSTLAYIKDVSGVAGSRTGKVDAEGFYYFDGTEWVKLGGGVSNGSGFGDAVLSAPVTVTQKGNDVTFNTGYKDGKTVSDADRVPGKVTVNGSSQFNGSSFVKVKELKTETAYTIDPDDYYIAVNGPAAEVVITLPEPSANKGRVLIVTNATSQNVAFILPNGEQGVFGSDNPSIAKDLGEWLICDGTKWFNLINF